MPRAAWARWAWALAVGALLCAGLTLALTLLARTLHHRGLAAWDRELLLRVERLPFSFHSAIFWEAFGASSILVPMVAVAAVLSVRSERPVLAASFVAAFALAKPIFLVGWVAWNRARPELIAGGIAAPEAHSFPSGHAVQTVTVYGLLAYLWLRSSSSMAERALGVCAWIALSAVVGLSRLRLGVHWPSDVIAGSAIGLAWLAVLVVALRGGGAPDGR